MYVVHQREVVSGRPCSNTREGMEVKKIELPPFMMLRVTGIGCVLATDIVDARL